MVVGTDVGQGRYPEAEEGPVLVDRQLGMGFMVAAMGIGQERLGTIGRPLNRAVEFFGRPKGDDLVPVDIDL